NTTWQDSVCVEVVSPCANTDTTFADSTTFAGTDTITGESIFVAGTFFVNGTLVLNNCMVYVNAGGQIIVQSNGNLILNSTTIQSCDTMWRGINVLASGKLKLNGSTLRDANTGIYAVHQSQVEILQSEIYDCVTGLMIPPRPSGGYNSIALKVDGSRFKMQAANFKPDYAGQTPHGSIPKAGIDMTNMITTIGATNLNEFDKLNAGIVAKSSIVTVKRSMFTKISYDTFYNEPYRGTAIVSVGVPAGDILTGNLTVLPEAISYNTVDNCYRGIYVNKSALYADYIHILNVTHGVFGTNISFQQTATVSNSVITASSSGLSFISNPFAKAVYLASNDITINGVNNPNLPIQPAWYGIQMRENNVFATVRYNATNNTIHLNNGTYGIYSGMLNRANIKFNVIRITGNGYGINAQSNLSASVSCNTINGNYTAGLSNSYGISIGNLSYNTSMYCNSVDSLYNGIYFGGINPSTYLKATEFHHHFNGLYLNNAANISWQTLYGNRWNTINNSFQAYNANTQGYTSSLFFVDTALGSTYSPTNNIPGNNGWFQPSAGNTFYCSNSTVCSTPPVALTDSVLNLMIANGTLESEEYAEESKAIAEEYLFRQIMEDSTLIEADSAYAAFMEENMGEPVEYLYNAEEYMRAAYSYDTVYSNLIDSCKLQIKLFTDSINMYSSGTGVGTTNSDSLKTTWFYKVNFLNQTINNINLIREAMLAGNAANAKLINEIVVPDNLPQENTKYMNSIEANYLERGNDIQYIADNFSGIYSIASQCPYSGGRAVEKARSFMALLNDTIAYNDNNVCLQSGIYRYANDTVRTVEENKIIIQPNPASNEVSIILKGEFEGLCNIQIKNAMGEEILFSQMNCAEKQRMVDVSNLAQGVYIVKVNVNNITFLNSKLVIVR
ncbi:MAG: T9SS type A sorting domain-containing protein, partial [Bacteroidetes bacterium]|nr:T9SS type A sorting domain-containing protein [Bacteroidia bacterium]MCW5932474.1 T9SS type A sorting domain-containing protein [Bacteroidota bacterium]